MRFVGLVGFWVCLALTCGCQKASSQVEGSPSPSATSPGTSLASAAAPVKPDSAEAPLTGLDACLVGSWKGASFSMSQGQASAEGGANLALQIAASGDSVLDFDAMAPVQGKAGGASFDFRYFGKATALLSTPSRGAITSDKADYSKLAVSANVSLPGAGKIALFKNKPLSELSQMAAGLAGVKAPGVAAGAPGPGAAPAGLDASPVFSTSRYDCQGDTLTLFVDKAHSEWRFTRAAK